MAKKWNKVIARIEALEDALARLMAGGRRKKKPGKTRRGKSRTAKPSRAKTAPARKAKPKKAKAKRAKPARSRPRQKSVRKPRAAESLPPMPELPVATL